ncbi:unnamed protein product [Mytilus coruscus]|uniref:PiggyBac transposable element-derived protein domain-containing protein n=1 Tax=Mytilus coruscus TaxID=42192 RepID=A0A6J8AFR3_MYTCO|nr:unnamed protein product [Mytilus coruscus]
MSFTEDGNSDVDMSDSYDTDDGDSDNEVNRPDCRLSIQIMVLSVGFDANLTPYEYFEKFINEDYSLFDIIVEETNRYATTTLHANDPTPQGRGNNWKPVFKQEISAFFCLAVERGQAGYDPLHKVANIIEFFNRAFEENYRYKVVMDLMRPHFGNQHHVTIDSWFTSPKLVHDLRNRGTYCTGTVITTRKGMPQSFRKAKIPKGGILAKSQGPVMSVLYSDRRQVSLLTTAGSAKLHVTFSKSDSIITENSSDKNFVRWKSEQKSEYVGRIHNDPEGILATVMNKLDELSVNNDATQNDINNIVLDISKNFKNAAAETFGKIKKT